MYNRDKSWRLAENKAHSCKDLKVLKDDSIFEINHDQCMLYHMYI